jgi:hypothetical protein
MDERGWNIPRLSATADIKDPVIRRWFGKKPMRPSDGNLRKVARALDVPVEDLLRMCGYLPSTANLDLAVVPTDPRRAALISIVRDHVPDEDLTALERMLSGYRLLRKFFPEGVAEKISAIFPAEISAVVDSKFNDQVTPSRTAAA